MSILWVIAHIILGVPRGRLPKGFPTKFLNTFSIHPNRTQGPSYCPQFSVLIRAGELQNSTLLIVMQAVFVTRKVTTAEQTALSAALQQLISHVTARLAGLTSLLQSGRRHRSPCSNAGATGFVGSVSWFHFTPYTTGLSNTVSVLSFHSSNNPNLSHPTIFHLQNHFTWPVTSGLPRNFVRGGGGSTNSVEERENGDMGAVAL